MASEDPEVKISKTALDEIRAALLKYEQEVDQSRLREKTKRTYLHHASTFVRWLADDFTPGATLT